MLLGGVTVLAVFTRRVVLLRKENAPALPRKRKKVVEEEVEEKKTRLKRGDKAKIENLMEKAEVKAGTGKVDEAVKFLVQLLAIDEDHIPAQNKLAMMYMKKEMYGAAAALFQRLAELEEDAVHYSHLGLALYQQQDHEGARAAYQRSVELDDSRPARFVSLGQVYRALGQYQNAIIAVGRAIELEEEGSKLLKDYEGLIKEIEKEIKEQ